MGEKLKRAVIKEELVTLTGDIVSAVLLNQILYWSERTRDSDQYIAEERVRDPETNINPQRGWIYKSAKELLGETMLGVSEATIIRRLQHIVDSGWLLRRQNPRYKWDRTWQYRPDIHRIQSDLATLGYALDTYPLQIEGCNSQDEITELQDEASILHGARAIPETTSETTSERIGREEAKTASSQGDPSGSPERPLSALQRDQNAKRKALIEHFEKLTGLKEPERGSMAGVGKLWWNPIREILSVCGWDLVAASQLMDHTLKRLNGMTIADPNSLLKTARAIRAEQTRASPVGFRREDGVFIMPVGGSASRGRANGR